MAGTGRIRRRRWPFALVVAALVAAGCTGDDAATEPSTTAPVSTVGSTVGSGGSTDVAGRYRATIRRTEDGVPHVRADDLGSLAFGNGWASAEDHLCTLADQVLKIRGERARWLGEGDGGANVDSDFAWRAIGLHARSVDDWPGEPAGVREQFEAFAAGWNAYLADQGADRVSGWCAGEPWVGPIEPVDVYAYGRSVTLNASSARLVPYLGTAQPPAGDSPTTTEQSLEALAVVPPASNGWAIGAERSATGNALLVGNPHFPWEGELRFWEVHLTVPGEMDVYGVQLLGLPGVGIGFTEGVGWTHTVSAGNRFTAYLLRLKPGDPTTYLVDGEERPMTAREETVGVLGDDGATTSVTRTLWFTEHGPVLDFPGVGWTDGQVLTYRDANIDNSEMFQQYRAMNQARNLGEFQQAHAEHRGVPLFNTIAIGADGRAWYADTAATPNLSPEALAAYEEARATDLLTGIAAQNGVVLLDGSTSLFDWVEEPGARDPGLVPYERMPQAERGDYLFNANDSFWVSNADHLLSGDYSPLHGRQGVPQSPRTRENATLLRDTSAGGPAGGDGRFDLDELAAAALGNTGYTARVLRDAVVARCTATPLVEVPELAGSDGTVALPAESVDVGPACGVLAGWDGRYDLDSRGAHVWRELVSRFSGQELRDAGALWAGPFDPARPVDTPAGLAPPPPGGPDPVLVHLARAVQTLAKVGVALDAPLGDLQHADRNGTLVPIHGGTDADGTTNIVGSSSFGSSTEPVPERPPPDVPGSGLRGGRYPIDNGTSFVYALELTPDGPRAQAILTYGETGDRTSPLFVSQTERFSAKRWRPVRFSAADIEADPALEVTEVTGG